ncbi:MAG: thioesterase family protein [Actinomycetota bacterium]|jgi:hypothetical protein|nr:thioesterase family protein [Actinomycetota bacterium]
MTPAEGTDALFEPEGSGFAPTELARGPWSHDALHGGPVAALIVHALERDAAPDGDLALVRLTVELLRPVPVSHLAVSTFLVRPGRKVQLVDAVVTSGGTEVAWARALRIRRVSSVTAAATVEEDSPPPRWEHGRPTPSFDAGYRAFHNGGVEIRFVEGRFDGLGPATAWFRLRCPVVAGHTVSPWQRAAAVADFGNGISAELEFDGHVFINPDLTVGLHRPPTGEWVCLAARTRFGTPGVGTCESALWDEQGRIGRAVQNLLVEPRC